MPRLPDEARPVLPVRIFLLDQLDLPVTFPAFQLLFAGDCFLRGGENLDVDEAIHAIRLYELGTSPAAMLIEPRADIVGDADVEGAVVAAGQDVE